MEKQSRRTLSLKQKRPVRRGAASHVPQPRGITEPPPQTEEGEEDHSPGRAQRWEAQWLDFLDRVKSDEMLEDEALWGEAKVLLASLGPETEACRSRRHEFAMQHAEVTLRRLPQEWRSWLGERGLQLRSQVVALAKAYRSRQYNPWEWEYQVAAGTSSSAVQKNPPDLGQEADGQQSLVAGHVPDCGKEEDHPGASVGRGEDETLVDWESPKGQEGNNPTDDEEEKMDESCPGGAFQAPEQQAEGSGDRSPGTQSSPNTQEELSNASGCETPSTGGKRFLCSECGKRFTWGFQLTAHRRIHTGAKPFKCSECEKCFRHRKSLRRHRLIHAEEKPYKCSECEQSFSRLESLQGHRLIHTGERPYQCSECEKCFRHRASLQRHKKTHTGEKPYKCSRCEKSFTQMETLRDHRRIHTGEKPFKCSKCEKSFRSRSNLRQHQAGRDCSKFQAVART